MLKPKKLLVLFLAIIFTVIAALPASASNEINKTFHWQYGGRDYEVSIDFPADLLNMEREFSQDISDFFYKCNSYQQYIRLTSLPDILKPYYDVSTANMGYFVPWVKATPDNEITDKLANDIRKEAQKASFDSYHTAEFTLSFVGSAVVTRNTLAPQFPLQTLIDGGDCKSKSILLATLLKNMGYKVVMLSYPPATKDKPGHIAIGIALNDNSIPRSFYGRYYYEHNNIKYFFAETTTPGWSIGQLSDPAKERPAYIYPIN